ncbi:hypothetical protein NBRC116492_07100 [Aurantivibrio infirmus]
MDRKTACKNKQKNRKVSTIIRDPRKVVCFYSSKHVHRPNLEINEIDISKLTKLNFGNITVFK